MRVGARVKLKTFNGSVLCADTLEPSENYWLLVGAVGTISKTENSRGRVLVVFEIEVSSLGLHCHNEIPNSLLILPSDLEVL